MDDSSSADAPTTHSAKAQTALISDDKIRARAYDLWERHHRPEGYEMQFWFMAKRELMAEQEQRSCALWPQGKLWAAEGD